MNRVWIALFALFTLLPPLAWFASTPADMSSANFWSWRHESIYASGLMAYAAFAACMLLAARTRWLEQRLDGLDKSYRLHKWLGISGATLVFAHWMLEILPKSLVQSGWLTRPARGGGPKPEQWLDFLSGPAKEVGEWMAYLMIALALIALVRLIPYHWFRRLHKVFPLAFLAVTFHGAVLMPDAVWMSSAGLLFALCAGVGSAASVHALRGHVGRARQHAAKVAQVRALADDVVEIECELAGAGMPYRAGQFAFVSWGVNGEPHPFTIASASNDPRRLRFCIKALGDDTRALPSTLRPGMAVMLEGPYGGFDFNADGKEQVWVGAGIGITPFLARLETLAGQPAPAGGPIDFYYCAPADSPFADRLRGLCERAGVRLHWVDAQRDGQLNLERILADRRAARDRHLWFCGPQAFGDALQRAWRQAGLKTADFHREYFAFR
ncbi:MAG: ferric reductase-like transmembrane domain-containing protein [Zoogloeaceae bacterium]|nr:ferric reductase-like transmembrane domain-containing protein [Zoogloeaceae bacterium]